MLSSRSSSSSCNDFNIPFERNVSRASSPINYHRQSLELQLNDTLIDPELQRALQYDIDQMNAMRMSEIPTTSTRPIPCPQRSQQFKQSLPPSYFSHSPSSSTHSFQRHPDADEVYFAPSISRIPIE